MIHDIIWQEAKSIQGAGRMQLHRNTRSTILVFTYPFDFGCLMKVPRADAFSEDMKNGQYTYHRLSS
jgi:hypothetical protein